MDPQTISHHCQLVDSDRSDQPYIPFDPLNQWSSFGINVRHILGASNQESGNEVEVELAAFPQSITREFYAEFHYNDTYWGEAVFPTSDFSAPIRIAFNSTNKIFTVYYDADPSPDYRGYPSARSV